MYHNRLRLRAASARDVVETRAISVRPNSFDQSARTFHRCGACDLAGRFVCAASSWNPSTSRLRSCPRVCRCFWITGAMSARPSGGVTSLRVQGDELLGDGTLYKRHLNRLACARGSRMAPRAGFPLDIRLSAQGKALDGLERSSRPSIMLGSSRSPRTAVREFASQDDFDDDDPGNIPAGNLELASATRGFAAYAGHFGLAPADRGARDR